MKTKILIILIVLIGLLPAFFTFAQTPTSESAVQILQQRIAELQKQLSDLQAQLEIIKKTETPATKTSKFTFTKILYRGIKDAEVTKLQEFLKQYPDIYPEGLITGYFGPLTEAAVKRFQEKHSIESIGIVGPKTRQKLNELISGQLSLTPQPMEPIKPKESVESDTSSISTTSTSISTPISIPPPTPNPKPAETCLDGTLYGQCSVAYPKPKYCNNGIIKDNCQVCGCETGYKCQQNGSCALGFQSGPPATWPEWLKQERENNIADVLEAEKKAKQNHWLSLQNESLPQFIE